jgi:hypothetical protein
MWYYWCAFLLVAHPIDEWPFGDSLITGRVVKQARSMQDRLEQAQYLIKELHLSWPVAIDEGSFEEAFAPWPVRFYVVHRGQMFFIAQPTDENCYDIRELRSAVDAACTLSASL